MTTRKYILRKKNLFECETKQCEVISAFEPDFQEVYSEPIQKAKNYGSIKRIFPEEYTSYHHYPTLHPGLSDEEEYAKSQEDGWFYAE